MSHTIDDLVILLYDDYRTHFCQYNDVFYGILYVNVLIDRLTIETTIDANYYVILRENYTEFYQKIYNYTQNSTQSHEVHEDTNDTNFLEGLFNESNLTINFNCDCDD